MKLFHDIVGWVVLMIGKIQWPASDTLTPEEQDGIRKLLSDNYFIVLTYRRNHLSSSFVKLANFVLTGKWGRWSHALMNLEDEVEGDDDFRLVEATGKGTHYTPFEKVFDVHRVALLKPKNMPVERWTDLLDRAKAQIGKPYDTLFNIKDAQALSCVELVRYVLQGEPNYEQDFADFERLIRERKNLSPQMFADCKDFEVFYSVRD